MIPTNVIVGSPGRELETHTTRRYPLGTQMVFQDGRKFRYCQAGGSNLVASTLQQASANTANHLLMTPTAAAVGATEVTVTLGATAATLNDYQDGYLSVVAGTGMIGTPYPIRSHPAAGSGAALTVTLQNGIAVAIPATAASIDLMRNRYKSVIQYPTTATSIVAGVAVRAITTLQFGWLQTAGYCVTLVDGTVVLGDIVVPSNGTAGAVEAMNATYLVADKQVGLCVKGTTTGLRTTINLTIDN